MSTPSSPTSAAAPRAVRIEMARHAREALVQALLETARHLDSRPAPDIAVVMFGEAGHGARPADVRRAIEGVSRTFLDVVRRTDPELAARLDHALTEQLGEAPAAELAKRAASALRDEHNAVGQWRARRTQLLRRVEDCLRGYDHAAGHRHDVLLELSTRNPIWVDTLSQDTWSAFADALRAFAEAHPEEQDQRYHLLCPARPRPGIDPAVLVTSHAYASARRPEIERLVSERLSEFAHPDPSASATPILRARRVTWDAETLGEQRMPPVALPGLLCASSYLGLYRYPDRGLDELRGEDVGALERDIERLREAASAVPAPHGSAEPEASGCPEP